MFRNVLFRISNSKDKFLLSYPVWVELRPFHDARYLQGKSCQNGSSFFIIIRVPICSLGGSRFMFEAAQYKIGPCHVSIQCVNSDDKKSFALSNLWYYYSLSSHLYNSSLYSSSYIRLEVVKLNIRQITSWKKPSVINSF